MPLAACGADPQKCLADCLEFSNGSACFALAAIVQAGDLDPMVGENLCQMACSSGDVAGCVNRAAGLRNTTYPNDPYPKRPAAAREACQYKSFSIGCEANDPWGCAMRGQARALGEGVPANAAAARRDYATSCKISPDFAACTFAKRALAEMGRTR